MSNSLSSGASGGYGAAAFERVLCAVLFWAASDTCLRHLLLIRCCLCATNGVGARPLDATAGVWRASAMVTEIFEEGLDRRLKRPIERNRMRCEQSGEAQSVSEV
jgi:hypothetical protein